MKKALFARYVLKHTFNNGGRCYFIFFKIKSVKGMKANLCGGREMCAFSCQQF